MTLPLRPELGMGRTRLVSYTKGDDIARSYYRLEEDFRWWMHMGAEVIDRATQLMDRAHTVFTRADSDRNHLTDLERRWIRRGSFMIEALVSCFDDSNMRCKLPAFDRSWKGCAMTSNSPIDIGVYSVYYYPMNSKQIIKRLKDEGFELVKVTGDHHKFKHQNGRIVIVPHPKKDLPIGTVRNIFRQAGLEWRS